MKKRGKFEEEKKKKPKIGIYLCKDLYVHHRFERLTHYTIVSNTL